MCRVSEVLLIFCCTMRVHGSTSKVPEGCHRQLQSQDLVGGRDKGKLQELVQGQLQEVPGMQVSGGQPTPYSGQWSLRGSEVGWDLEKDSDMVVYFQEMVMRRFLEE